MRFSKFCILGLDLVATKSRYPFTDTFGLSWQQQLPVSFFCLPKLWASGGVPGAYFACLACIAFYLRRHSYLGSEMRGSTFSGIVGGVRTVCVRHIVVVKIGSENRRRFKLHLCLQPMLCPSFHTEV